MKSFKEFVAEGFSLRSYYRVPRKLTVYKKASGSGINTQYGELKLNSGAELHDLPGGLFAVYKGKSLGYIKLSNPNDDTEAQHHSRSYKSGGGDTMHKSDVSRLIKARLIEPMEPEDATTDVKYN